jgi:hypothetical protein
MRYASGVPIDPANTVEIDADATTDFNYGVSGLDGGTGLSGLRFNDLSSSSTPSTANDVVLSVTSSGDVILVKDQKGSVANCGSGAALTVDGEINQDAKNFYFRSNGNGGNVGMGLPCNQTPSARLHVYADNVNTETAGRFESTLSDDGNPNRGVLGIAENGKTDIGGEFYASNDDNGNNFGVYATASQSPYSYPSICPGVVPYGGGSIGGAFIACGSNSANIGVYAYAPHTGNLTDVAGYFDGDVYVNGPVSGFNYLTVSDSIFKTNIEAIPNALNIISQLNPKTYFFNTNNTYGMRFNNKRQYGLIAEEVEEVLPELVYDQKKKATYDTSGNIVTDSVNYKALNYNNLFAIMLKGMQEQQQRINDLEGIVNNCCNSGARQLNPESSSIDVELNNAKAIILNQNVPNPFAEQTTITYFIPDGTGKTQIIFYDNTGTILKVVDVQEKGKGQLNVFAADLSSGVYTYSLIADGKLIETKKMVCNK